MEDIDNLKATELTLGLPGAAEAPKGAKRVISEVGSTESQAKGDVASEGSVCEGAPAAKAQIVGWPPVRSYRMNSFRARKADAEDAKAGMYVKVGMDGAPYLRKVDLKVHRGYKDLRMALENMFQCFSLGEGEGYHGSEYAITYEDKDGDWMLVGDVPWEMFVSSCKRMRIMRGSEAKGLSSSPS